MAERICPKCGGTVTTTYCPPCRKKQQADRYQLKKLAIKLKRIEKLERVENE